MWEISDLVEARMKPIVDQALAAPRTSEARLRSLADRMLDLESAAIRYCVACDNCPREYEDALVRALGEGRYQQERRELAKLVADGCHSAKRFAEFEGSRELNLLAALRPVVAARRGRQSIPFWQHLAPGAIDRPGSKVLEFLGSEWLSTADSMQAKSQYIALEVLSYIPFDLELFEDMYQEASYGLRRAILKYDPMNGTIFRSYASMYAYRFAQRASIDMEHVIAIPVQLHAMLTSIMRTGLDWGAEGAQIADADAGVRSRRQKSKAIAAALAVQPRLGGARFESLDPRERVRVIRVVDCGAEQIVDLARLSRDLNRALAREKAHYRAMFLEYITSEDATLEEIGSRHGVTRERVRQVVVAVRERLLRRLAGPGEYIDDSRDRQDLRVAERWRPAAGENLAKYEGRALLSTEWAKRRYIAKRLAAQARETSELDLDSMPKNIFVNEQILAFLKGGS